MWKYLENQLFNCTIKTVNKQVKTRTPKAVDITDSVFIEVM